MNDADRLDPEVVSAFVCRPPTPADLDVLGVRRYMEAGATMEGPVSPATLDPTSPDDIHVEDRMIAGPGGAPQVRVRLYQPRQHTAMAPLPALLWIHGGGFFLGHIKWGDQRCQDYALNVGCVVAAVDYRLAPEHPFPAGLEDCYAALAWLAASSKELGVDPARIAVGGISAGGCLAAAVALLARDRQGPAINYQLLLVPCLDDRHITPSSHAVTDLRTWNRDLSIKAWAAYLADLSSTDVPAYAAPARATDLSGLPPAYVGVAEYDLLRDEGIDYAQRLMQAGVRTELHVFAGTFHGSSGSAPEATVSKRESAEVIAVLRHALGQPTCHDDTMSSSV